MDENVPGSLPVAWPVVGAGLHAADRDFDAFSLALPDKVFGNMQEKSVGTCRTALWNQVLHELDNGRQIFPHPISCVGRTRDTYLMTTRFPLTSTLSRVSLLDKDMLVGSSLYFPSHRVSSTCFGWLATE